MDWPTHGTVSNEEGQGKCLLEQKRSRGKKGDGEWVRPLSGEKSSLPSAGTSMKLQPALAGLAHLPALVAPILGMTKGTIMTSGFPVTHHSVLCTHIF